MTALVNFTTERVIRTGKRLTRIRLTRFSLKNPSHGTGHDMRC
jgi:hypothetical protein